MLSRNGAPASIGATSLWSLTFVLLLTTGNARLLACDDGTAVPDPDKNRGLVADCTVLLGLREELAGTGSLNWDADLAISDWQGITISGSPSRVSALKLRETQLTGQIPAELANLTQLQELHLYYNQLTGPIPRQIGEMTRLQSLGLTGNQLNGPIPVELAQLERLEQLSLGENHLTGPIPKELVQLSQLRVFSLRDNQLTGPIPKELAQLSHLQHLSLGQNQLAGPIPAELGQLSQLRSLYLPDSHLTGPIPNELAQLSQLQWLVLGGNRLTGPIPPQLAELSRLRWLLLGENQLTGPIPLELARLSRLDWLRLHHNRLTGPIPAELARLSRLEWLRLEHNVLTGPIPLELGQLSRLIGLRLDHNRLTDSIPNELGQLYGLALLRLDHNVLTGPIPPELGQLFQLGWLHLDHNRLTGSIPIELGQLFRLGTLHLDHNRLTGPIPAVLGQLSELLFLHLQHNRLSGPFPAELGQLSTLWQFSFRGNRLTGPVPPELSRLPDLYVLNLDARWVGPDRIKVTWDDPGDPTAVYRYRLRGFDFEILVDSTEIPKTWLRPGKGVTIEWTLTGLPTEVAYKSIELRASNSDGSSPAAVADVRSSRPPSDIDQERYPPPYCLSLWDGDPCATSAVLPHVFMGPLGVNTAEAEILITNRDPDPQSCEMALLFHRGTFEAPEILFDGQPIEGNLYEATVPRGGARVLTLTADSEELVVGAVSVFVRSPCTVDSLRVQGRYLVEEEANGDIQEVFSVSGQTPREWLGDGDCQDITGVFGAGRDLGFASVTAEPERGAPAGTRLYFRSFDLKGNPTAESPGSLEITGEQAASFPWNFQEPTILEMCLDVPEENSDFELSTIAIGIVQKGGNVQWSDEAFTRLDSSNDSSAVSDSSP